MVVLLGYAPSFQRTIHWHKQAQYETKRGEICGFKIESNKVDEVEFVLYYGEEVQQNYVRLRFQGLFEEILYSRNVSVKMYIPVICHKCKCQQERRTVIRFVEEGKKNIFCANDGKKLNLPKVIEHLLSLILKIVL